MSNSPGTNQTGQWQGTALIAQLETSPPNRAYYYSRHAESFDRSAGIACHHLSKVCFAGSWKMDQ